ncbi:Histidine kinase-like ATPase domain-containing protein [Streptomyces wuyuanensis]|uniref:Histidine kinase-like ATPase domain-containing protein n=2 Tax=Streptomyces wuyuanensis TaxID=1196353 RepID=A0A1G9ZFL0_9ACTN|nr:Histidine kinase-like ATPase domain-containing protein [Streptomyces wuyuanensis]
MTEDITRTCAPAPASQYGMRFTVGAHSARHVRRILRSYLDLWGMPGLVDDASLALTELLANVVRHVPDRRCALLIERGPEGVRVEVRDESPVLPRLLSASPEDESGRGLALLGAVVHKWGVSQTGAPGKTVWFECRDVPRPDDSSVRR